jgi:hypothetical protein
VTEDASWQRLPTTMGFAAKNAIDALRRRNVATAPVLRAAAIARVSQPGPFDDCSSRFLGSLSRHPSGSLCIRVVRAKDATTIRAHPCGREAQYESHIGAESSFSFRASEGERPVHRLKA